jgi:flagellar biosynthesis/type III secretory pathway ATPase
MARLHSKLVHKEKNKVVSSMASALKIYEEVYNYLKKNEYYKMSDQLMEHMNICEEMINLLPTKINKINTDEE